MENRTGWFETDLYPAAGGDLILMCPQCALEKGGPQPCWGVVNHHDEGAEVLVDLFLGDRDNVVARAIIGTDGITIECCHCGRRTSWKPRDGSRVRMRHSDTCARKVERPAEDEPDAVVGRLVFRAR